MYKAKDVFSEYNSYWLQLGVDHQFTETLNLYLSIGPRYTEFDFRGPFGLDASTNDSTFMMEFRLRKVYETWNMGATLRSFENPSSSGRLLRTRAAEFNLDGKLSVRTSYGLGTGFYRNTSTGGLDDDSQNRDYFYFKPRLSWKAPPGGPLPAVTAIAARSAPRPTEAEPPAMPSSSHSTTSGQENPRVAGWSCSPLNGNRSLPPICRCEFIRTWPNEFGPTVG